MITTPTTQDLAATMQATIAAKLEQTIPPFAKAFIPVLTIVLAGALVLLHKYAGWQLLQLFVAHATLDETVIGNKRVSPLREWGRLFGAGNELPATQAQHLVTVLVTVQVGSLPAGAQLLRADTEVLYEVVSAVPLNAASVQATVRAISGPNGTDGTGTIGNLNPGDELEFTSTPANVSRVVTVLSTLVLGGDAETPEAYRLRIVRRVQAKPQGGAYADYRIWGEEVPGVFKIYPYASDDPGVVEVFVEVDSSIEPDGIAPAPYLTAVYNAIELNVDGIASRRPIGAAVWTKSISRTGLDVFVRGFSVDPAVISQAKLDVKAAVEEYMLSREPFIVGLTALPREDRVTVAALSGVVDGVVASYGGTVTKVDLEFSGAPITAYTLDKGERVKSSGVVEFL
jgi:uncharacterized phage protein gp47/JayE